ncbi:MAG TPA: hypothetical protein DCW29_24240 [Janthinobacterium sp.]|nr:hypothetical protein [Janthinobacterium sp.]
MALAGGMYMLGIKLVAGIPVQAKEVFAHFKRIVPLSIAMILMGLLITIGFILLIIPGIYLAVAYTMAMPLILEKNMSPWQALETSRKTITRHWFRMCGFIIANTILGIVATLLLGIGLIWYVPFSLICLGLIYRNMFGFSDELVQS